MNFELHDKNADKTPVYFVIRKQKNGHKVFLKYPTDIIVNPDYWNETKRRVKEQYGLNYKSANKTLDDIEAAAKYILNNNDFFFLDGDKVRYKIDMALKRPGSLRRAENFREYAESWIEKQQEKKGYDNVKSFKTTLKKIPKNINWNSFDFQFYNKMVDDLEKQGYSKNYIGRQINNLKILLSHAFKEGLHTNENFRQWKVLSEEVYNVYLTKEELKKIEKVPLPDYLELSRNLFLLGCYTGLRAGNYLKTEDIHIQDNFMVAIANKGGPRVKIPIHPTVRKILGKYGGLPESVHDVTLNRQIKDICRAAKINTPVLKVRTEGGKRIETVKQKWELVTTHTARRTLVTLLYLENAPLKYIMSITGHKTEAQCLKYIKTGLDELADKVAELSFWK